MNWVEKESQINFDQAFELLRNKQLDEFVRTEEHKSRWSKKDYSSSFDITYEIHIDSLRYKLNFKDVFYPMGVLGYNCDQNYSLEIFNESLNLLRMQPSEPSLSEWIKNKTSPEYQKLKGLVDHLNRDFLNKDKKKDETGITRNTS